MNRKDPEAVSTARIVLIIEDSRVQTKIIAKRIQGLAGFATLHAYSLEDAREILDTRAPELFAAVVDLNLPDAPDGEAVDLVLSYKVPAVVLTATFNDDIRSGFIERQVADYFFKGSIRDMDPMVTSLERLYKNRFINVMVVDDSKPDRNLMRRLLEIQRYKVLEAEDGSHALDILKANPDVGLVITDFVMPDMDGTELTRLIRENHRKDALAVIGVSSAGSGALTATFLKNGANDFLTKPFEVEEFYWRVNQNIEMLEMFHELKLCYEELDK